MTVADPVGQSGAGVGSEGSGWVAGRWSGVMLSVLRMFSAFVYMQHGVQKQFGWLGGAGGPGGVSTLPPFLFLVAGVLETYGGFLMFIGLLTRPAAFLASGEMAVAYFWRHAPRAFWPVINRGEVPALLCYIFLFLAVAGGGRLSLDHLLARRRERARARLGAEARV